MCGLLRGCVVACPYVGGRGLGNQTQVRQRHPLSVLHASDNLRQHRCVVPVVVVAALRCAALCTHTLPHQTTQPNQHNNQQRRLVVRRPARGLLLRFFLCRLRLPLASALFPRSAALHLSRDETNVAAVACKASGPPPPLRGRTLARNTTARDTTASAPIAACVGRVLSEHAWGVFCLSMRGACLV